MLEALVTVIDRYGLLPVGRTAVVAVSGGPDSTAMLHALVGLRKERGWRLVAAHLNHGFRGAEADADADYVAALCDRLEVEVRIERIDVPALAQRRHKSAQEAAREARHAFLRRVAAEVDAVQIAVGHTRDDRIETILMNLLRGTGAEGLAGFPPAAGLLARPLYDISRAEVRAYCEAFDLNPRIDSSNSHFDYLRNRIRAELLPQLASYYNEKAEDALLRMSALISADNECLEAQATEHLHRADQSDKEGKVCLPCETIEALPIALRRRVLRQAIAQVRGHLQGVTFEIIERLLDAAGRRQLCGVTLPADGPATVRAGCNRKHLIIERQEPASSPVPWETLLLVPGRTELPYRLGVVETIVLAGPDDLPAANCEGDRMLLTSEDVALPLTARSWKSGDRISLPHVSGHKKLQDLFVDARVPAAERTRMPVIVDARGTVLGVPGLTPRWELRSVGRLLIRQISVEECR